MKVGTIAERTNRSGDRRCIHKRREVLDDDVAMPVVHIHMHDTIDVLQCADDVYGAAAAAHACNCQCRDLNGGSITSSLVHHASSTRWPTLDYTFRRFPALARSRDSSTSGIYHQLSIRSNRPFVITDPHALVDPVHACEIL